MTGVIEQNVKPSPVFLRLGKERLDGVGITNVRRDREHLRPNPCTSHLSVLQRRQATPRKNDRIPCLPKGERDRLTDATSGTSDYSVPSGSNHGCQRRTLTRTHWPSTVIALSEGSPSSFFDAAAKRAPRCVP